MRNLLFALFAFTACGDDAVTGDDAPPPTEPVYYGQVERIINDNCVECHSASPDRLAPFSLATYEDVAAAVDAQMPIAFDVMNRIMPPFYADQDNCHTFPNAKWLSAEELDTLTSWVNGTHAAGDPANALNQPPPELPELAHVDHVVDTGVDYTPSTAASDDFRCFVVDGIGANKFVTGAYFKPSNLTVAHHGILFTLDTPEAETEALQRQAAAGGPYRCDGGPTQVPSTFLVGWIPGERASLFPPNTGIRLDGSRKMVVQMHYNTTSGDGRPDHTKIELQLADSVAQPGQMVRLQGDVNLPPHQADAIAHGSVTLPANTNAKLWGTVTHMHQRGTGALVKRNDECLLDLVNWSFHWQQFYWYDAPVQLNGGDTIDLTCHYDTTGDSSQIKFCETTDCEMCIQIAYVTAN